MTHQSTTNYNTSTSFSSSSHPHPLHGDRLSREEESSSLHTRWCQDDVKMMSRWWDVMRSEVCVSNLDVEHKVGERGVLRKSWHHDNISTST